MCFPSLSLIFFSIQVTSGYNYFYPGSFSSDNVCVLEMDSTTLHNFSNCSIIYDGYLPFIPMTIPTCPNSNHTSQCFTPRDTDLGMTCFNYIFDIPMTNQSVITIDFWYHLDEGAKVKNYITVGFLKDEENWFYQNNDIPNMDLAEYQQLSVGPFDYVEGKLAVFAILEKALFCIHKITITNVAEPCVFIRTDENPLLSKTDPVLVDAFKFSDTNSCKYDFNDGKMTGLESCEWSWVDFGSKIIQLPNCGPEEEKRFVLTQKSLHLPSKTQTNRALKLTNDSEILIKFWSEIEGTRHLKSRNDVRISLLKTEDEEIVAEWKIVPQNRIWQTVNLKLKESVDISNKVKVLIDIGLYGQRIYIDYITITNTENMEDCYGSKLINDPPCE